MTAASATPTPVAGPRHVNNIGFLRLVLASLVIVAHSPEMIDGSSIREPLAWVFHTISFGAFAVDFFFILSGYLIAASYMSSRNVLSYLWKRVLRIYPAFIVGSLVCIFVVGPLGGGYLSSLGPGEAARSVARILALAPPKLAGSFENLHYPALNGAMWTIRYEFRCYLIVAVLGLLGLLQRRWLVLAGTVFLLALRALTIALQIDLNWGMLDQMPSADAVLLDLPQMVRLAGLFGSGMCFHLFKDQIPLKALPALAGLIVAVALLFSPALAEVGLGTAGAYSIFWLAQTKKLPILSRINNRHDISYGVYLYGWPVGSLVLFYAADITPGWLTLATLALSCMAGAASWFLVEKPALALKTQTRRSAS